MALVIAQLAMPILGALALSRVLRPRLAPQPLAPADPQLHPALAKAARAAAGTGAPAPLLSAEAAAVLPKVLYAGALAAGALRADRADLLRNDVWRGLLFIGAALGVLYFHLKGRLAVLPAAALMVGLVLVDLWGVDKRYLGENKFQRETIAEEFQPSPADQLILQDKDLSYRVLNLQNPFNEAQTSYFHKSIGGYHGAKLRRYQDLIERQISTNNQQVLNMLNTRYLITGDAKQPVQRNPGALGNAWFVSEVKTVKSPDEEMAALNTLSPATVAVVDASKFPQQQPATYDIAGSSIALTAYSPDELKYRYTAPHDGLVVFSEIYYADGWHAFIDGKPAPHLRADYVLRALAVPAGTHTIDFKIEPRAYAVGNGVSLAASIALLLVLVGAGVYVARRSAGPQEGVAVAPLA
ncbi:MAG: hypothetical protein NVSMB30_24540 [Hymenobacter sp.]